MTVRRVMVPDVALDVEEIVLSGDPAKHVLTVLRLGVGAEIQLLDGRGTRARAIIREVMDSEARLRITHRERIPRPTVPPLSLIQALPKGRGKMDEIIRRATELGVGVIIPALSHRSVARPSSERSGKRVERWRKIASEASRQCRRDHLPEVHHLLSLSEALEHLSGTSPGVMLWEDEGEVGFASRLENADLGRGVTVVIGPEGGFTSEEAAFARSLGYQTASLGTLVLRTETAAIAACALAQHYLGGFQPIRR